VAAFTSDSEAETAILAPSLATHALRRRRARLVAHLIEHEPALAVTSLAWRVCEAAWPPS